MIRTIKHYFQRPYPYDPDIKRKCRIILGFGLFIVAFILIFNLDESEGVDNIFIVMGIGLIIVLTMTINWIILPKLVPGLFREDNWNVIKEVVFHLWNFFTIGLANLLYANWGGYYQINLSTLIMALTRSVLIGILPVTFLVLLNHNRLLKKYLKSAKELNNSLQSDSLQPEDEKILNQPIILSSENEKDRIQLELGNLLFIKSIENYVEVFWTNTKGIQKMLLRSSLKRIEKKLNSYSSTFRCHRTYIVNIKNIERITGNSQGYRLIIKGVEDSVPVSRRYSKSFRKLFIHP